LGKAITGAGLHPELGPFGIDDLVTQTRRERCLEIERTEPVVLVPSGAEPIGTFRQRVVGLTAHLPSFRVGRRAVAAIVTGEAQGMCPFVARILDLERGICRLVLAVAARKGGTELTLALPVCKRAPRHAAQGDETDTHPFFPWHHQPPVSP